MSKKQNGKSVKSLTDKLLGTNNMFFFKKSGLSLSFSSLPRLFFFWSFVEFFLASPLFSHRQFILKPWTWILFLSAIVLICESPLFLKTPQTQKTQKTQKMKMTNGLLHVLVLRLFHLFLFRLEAEIIEQSSVEMKAHYKGVADQCEWVDRECVASLHTQLSLSCLPHHHLINRFVFASAFVPVFFFVLFIQFSSEVKATKSSLPAAVSFP